MTIRIPLVIVAGQVQQLQSGDSINVPTTTTDIRSLTNGESATTVTIGQPVYISAASSFKRAQSNALSTSDLIGLVYDTSIAAAASGNVAVAGVMTATTGQWDTVTGASGGLVFGTDYFVDPATPGKLTSTAPTTVGQVVVPVGTGLNTTDMELKFKTIVLL